MSAKRLWRIIRNYSKIRESDQQHDPINDGIRGEILKRLTRPHIPHEDHGENRERINIEKTIITIEEMENMIKKYTAPGLDQIQ